MTNTRAKVRKPKKISSNAMGTELTWAWIETPGSPVVPKAVLREQHLYAKEARRLAAWLIKAADWIERKEK